MALLGFMGLIVAVIIISALKEANTLEKEERTGEGTSKRRAAEETTRRKIGATAGTKRANPKR